MKDQHHHSTSLSDQQSKGNKYISQLQQIKGYFKTNTASRFMCAIDCHIPIQNVCRLVNILFKCNDIAVIRKDICRITGELVQYLSCNRSLFPEIPEQLNLFDNSGPQPAIKKQYELIERTTEEGAYYEVIQSNASKHLLKIRPFQWDGKRSVLWSMIFEGSLENCDTFVEHLKNYGNHD